MHFAEKLRAAAVSLRAEADRLDALARELGDIVDRRTCGLSGRQWDRLVRAGLPVTLRGRRRVARREDVAAWLERPAAVVVDELDALLERAGIRRR